jgi:hypothetical protein
MFPNGQSKQGGALNSKSYHRKGAGGFLLKISATFSLINTGTYQMNLINRIHLAGQYLYSFFGLGSRMILKRRTRKNITVPLTMLRCSDLYLKQGSRIPGYGPIPLSFRAWRDSASQTYFFNFYTGTFNYKMLII